MGKFSGEMGKCGYVLPSSFFIVFLQPQPLLGILNIDL